MSDTQSLLSILESRIAGNGGFLGFDAFMQAALYEPGLGYYESQAVFGEHGDFVTGADLGPWLSLGFLDLVQWSWQALGRPHAWTLIEQGGGSGRLLASLLESLQQSDVPMPIRIIEIERSEQLRARQQELFAASGFSVEHVSDPDALAPVENAVFFSNELPDAFPVRLFRYKGGRFFERGVGFDNGLIWLDSEEPLQNPPAIAGEVVAQWPDGYTSEWNPFLESWQRQLARIIRRGFVFTVDYGFSQREYYRANREQGTLLAHYRHQAHADVLAHPGAQDITAHVDFTALAQAGRRFGLLPLQWMPQGAWLGQSPSVQAHISRLAGASDADALREMAAARRMLMPFGMGEHFRLLVQASDAKLSHPAYLDALNRIADLA